MKQQQNIISSFKKNGLISFLLFFHLMSFGQYNPTLWFQSISPDIGFSQEYNFYLFHDSEGFIWISSTNGLNRFDGQRVKLYDAVKGDSTSLHGRNVHGKIFEDKKQNLWFSTSEAIHQYHRKSDQFSHYYIKSNPLDSLKKDYHTFAFEENQYLWIKSNDGVYRYDSQNNTDEFIFESSQFYIKSGVDQDNKVCKIFTFGTERGLDIFNIQDGELRDSLPGNFIKSVIKDVHYESDSLIWLSTDKDGLVRWNSISDEKEVIGNFSKNKISFAKLDSNTLILAVENQGVFQYLIEEEILQSITTRFLGKEENSSHGFWKIYIDDFKNIWISDKVHNVYFANFEKNKFTSIPKFKTQLNNSKYSFYKIIEDQNGNIWSATNNAGIIRFNEDEEKVKNYFHDFSNFNSIPSNMIYDLLLDHKNRIWAATSKGFVLYKSPNQFILIADETGKTLRDYTSIIELQNSQDILVASATDGIFKLEENGNKKRLKNIYQPSQEKTCDYLFEDGDGNIFVSFVEEGIGIFKYRKGQLIGPRKIKLEADVNCFWEDRFSETLWLGTSMGLMKGSKKDNFSNIEFVEIKGNSSNENINSILAEDGANFIWLGTGRGLVRFNQDSLTVQKFDIADGTQSKIFNLKAALKRKNDDLVFGGFNGITIIPSNKIDFVKTIPQLKITNIKINDLITSNLICEKTEATNVAEIQHLSRTYQDNTISLEFTTLEYSNPNSNQLEYQLIGVDKNPVRLARGDYGFARYPNLRPGEYIFKLRGANSDGIWGAFEEVLMITIRPPFNQTKEFYFLILLLISGIIYGIYRYRIAQIKKTEMLNTRIAENKMSALRAQMNPHFIYNSMQTVNGIISRKDTMGAVKYINQFSRLMRMILENSRGGRVSIEKEIEFLKSYMEIEKRRFQNPFSYNIIVGDEVDTFDTELPSMLTQPFVENAIKHGLFHKKEKGIINIKFLRENGSLKCIIEDDGVGRAKTLKLNAQSGRTHQSRGLQIVDERLELIRQSHPGNYKVKITDLFDLEQNALGTRVEVTLPFQH
ncbi:MAG: histidine kinase [Saprospiraceae bacterium]